MSNPNHFDLQSLPAWPQSQASLGDQTVFLIQVANRLGLHDAADAVTQLIPRISEARYGYHVDIEPGIEPDGCVIDEGNYHNCIYAKEGMRKEQCKYWRIVKSNGAVQWKHKALINLMKEISEDCWCAGWKRGLEYALWEIVQNPSNNEYGQGKVSLEDIQSLKEISSEIGGWFIQSDKPGAPLFVPMEEWVGIFRDYMDSLCKAK